LFSSGFPTNILYTFLFFPIRATCPVHPFSLTCSFYLYLANRTNYESPLPSFLQPHVTSSLFGPNILLSTLFPLYSLTLCSSLWWETMFHNHTEPQAKL
jgi:hypothetical protein